MVTQFSFQIFPYIFRHWNNVKNLFILVLDVLQKNERNDNNANAEINEKSR